MNRITWSIVLLMIGSALLENIGAQEQAHQPTPLTSDARDYEPPKAGQPLETYIQGRRIYIMPFLPLDLKIHGRKIMIPARDRRNVASLTLGAAIFSPRIADTRALPFGAFYYRHHWADDHRRLRAVLSGLVNDISFAEGTWNDLGVELLVFWQNDTIPFAQTEIVDGEEADFMEIEWGRLQAGIGIGWRQALPEGDFDNDFKIQLWYQPGYLYNSRGRRTDSTVTLPPDTFTQQLRLRLRLDSLARNFLELPHKGWACGLDFTLGRRDHWSDYAFSPILRFSRASTRDFLKLSGYAMVAFGIPWLSARHRFIATVHAGWMPDHCQDRFSAYRIGGGPLLSEADDLERLLFPGSQFRQFMASSYVISSFEYRFELAFFSYLHFRGTFMWGRFGMLESQARITEDIAAVLSIGFSTGFIWDSMIYVEYTLDDGFARRRDALGHGVLFSWSKKL